MPRRCRNRPSGQRPPRPSENRRGCRRYHLDHVQTILIREIVGLSKTLFVPIHKKKCVCLPWQTHWHGTILNSSTHGSALTVLCELSFGNSSHFPFNSADNISDDTTVCGSPDGLRLNRLSRVHKRRETLAEIAHKEYSPCSATSSSSPSDSCFATRSIRPSTSSAWRSGLVRAR